MKKSTTRIDSDVKLKIIEMIAPKMTESGLVDPELPPEHHPGFEETLKVWSKYQIPADSYAELDVLAELAENDEEFVESGHNGEYEQLIRSSIRLLRISESTHLVAVAVDKLNETNKYQMVHCVGDPIGGYAYDVTHDAYYLRCCDFIELGSIPVSYKMSMPNSNWIEFVALPDDLLERCLTQQQKRMLGQFKDRYKDVRFSVQFLQSIDC